MFKIKLEISSPPSPKGEYPNKNRIEKEDTVTEKKMQFKNMHEALPGQHRE